MHHPEMGAGLIVSAATFAAPAEISVELPARCLFVASREGFKALRVCHDAKILWQCETSWLGFRCEPLG